MRSLITLEKRAHIFMDGKYLVLALSLSWQLRCQT